MTTIKELLDKHERRAATLEKDLMIENAFISELRSIDEPQTKLDEKPISNISAEPVKKTSSVKDVKAKNEKRNSMDSHREKIISFLSTAIGPCSISDIVEHTGLDRHSISSGALYLMKHEGVIVSPSHGMYAMPENEKPVTERKLHEVDEDLINVPAYKPGKKEKGELDMDDFKEELY